MFGSFEESNDAGGAETAGVTTIQSAVNKAQLSETRRTSTPQSRGCNSVGAQVSARYPIIRCRTANSSSCAATNGLAFRPVRASAAIGDWSPFRASAAWRSSITVGARRLARGLADELRGGEEPVELREIAAEVVQLRALEPGAVELAGPDRPHEHAVALDLVASDEAGVEAEPLPVRDRHRLLAQGASRHLRQAVAAGRHMAGALHHREGREVAGATLLAVGGHRWRHVFLGHTAAAQKCAERACKEEARPKREPEKKTARKKSVKKNAPKKRTSKKAAKKESAKKITKKRVVKRNAAKKRAS